MNPTGKSTMLPSSPQNRDDLARIDAYFRVDGLAPEECDWVQDRGLGILYAEVERLRGVVARLEREKR